MRNAISFEDHVIVSCGTLIPELEHLRKSGFLDARRILYTKPGRHEVPPELESQLVERIRLARRHSDKIIVVYGGTFCYVNTVDLFRTIETVIEEQGPGIRRIAATHCVDMLAGAEERDAIADLGTTPDQKVLKALRGHTYCASSRQRRAHMVKRPSFDGSVGTGMRLNAIASSVS